MYKRKKRMSRKNIFITIIVVVLILLIVFSKTFKDSKNNNFVSSLLKDAVVSIQKVVYAPFNYVFKTIDNYTDLKNIKKEYDILKANVDKIDALETENIELRKEIEALKSELDIDYVLSDYEVVNASIVSRNVSSWYNTITLDKGSYNGIKVDMVVVNSSGLIGKVINVTTFTSTVKLITTTSSNNKISIAISNGDNKIYGLINGYNKGLLDVEGISNTEEVSIGDKVYTSGLGGLFPSGILIGEVKAITTDEYDLAKLIQVTPSADFNNLNYVSILKRNDDNDN